jgi:hypothetical protein
VLISTWAPETILDRWPKGMGYSTGAGEDMEVPRPFCFIIRIRNIVDETLISVRSFEYGLL